MFTVHAHQETDGKIYTVESQNERNYQYLAGDEGSAWVFFDKSEAQAWANAANEGRFGEFTVISGTVDTSLAFDFN